MASTPPPQTEQGNNGPAYFDQARGSTSVSTPAAQLISHPSLPLGSGIKSTNRTKHPDHRLSNIAALDSSLKGSPGIKELGLVSLHRPRRSSINGHGSKSARSPSSSPRKLEAKKKLFNDTPQRSDLASPTRPASRHVRMESYVTDDSNVTDVSEADKHITLSALDEQALLLEKMARQERKCLELKKMHAKEEAELERLRMQWESMFNQSTPDETTSSSLSRRLGMVDTPPNALNLSRSLYDKGTPTNKNAFFNSPSKMASFIAPESEEQDYTQVQAQAYKAFEVTKQKMSGLGKIIGGIFDGFILPEAVEIEERNRQVRAGIAQAGRSPQVSQKLSMQNLRESNRHSNSDRKERVPRSDVRTSPIRSKENLTPIASSSQEASYFPDQNLNSSDTSSWTWRSATLRMFENIDNAFGTYKVEPQTTPKQQDATSPKRRVQRRTVMQDLDLDSPTIR